MLGDDPFYYSINRKMTAAFGTIFNEIAVPRFDTSGNITEMLHVPLSYAPKERVEVRIIDDPDISRQSATPPLPRISFEQSSLEYDGDRMLNSLNRVAVIRDANTGNYKQQLEAVPYNFHYTLWVYSKTIEDGNKIVEQILPYFRPEFPLKVELIPEMGITMNIPVVLNTISLQDTFEGDFKGERRAIIWTLEFTMKGYMFGPIMEDKIIKFANVNFYTPTVANLVTAVGNSTPVERLTSQPGLTANGQPTSNISLTIDYHEINATDPYGYIDIVSGPLNVGEDTGGSANNLPFQG